MKTLVAISMLVVLITTAVVACGRGQPSPTTPMPPTVITNDATDITVTTARLNGNLDHLGTASSVDISLLWGKISGGPYPNETIQQAMTKRGVFSFELMGLDPGTVYYFQAKAAGDGISYGVEKSFTTLTEPPVVTTNDVTGVAVDVIRLNGTLDDLGSAISVDVSFIWGITSGGPYPNETALEVLDTGKAFSFDLTGLTPGTYYFQAKAVGDGVSYGVEESFIIPVTFADSNLEVAIREAINKPEGAIYLSDIESLTDLAASHRGISDISGLEYCSNLRGLHLDGNSISDIMPLSGLTDLLILILTDNNISDISPISGLTRLESLVITDNNVSDISPLAGLTSLNWLDLVQNNISDISPLAGLTSLDWLPLGGNNISDISPLVMNSGLSEGDFVHLGGNPLSDESINVHIPQLLGRGVNVER